MMKRYPISQTHTFVDVSNTSIEVLAANPSRDWALIQNQSSVDLWIALGVAAVVNACILLPANGGAYELSLSLGNVDVRAVNAIASAVGTNRVVITEAS